MARVGELEYATHEIVNRGGQKVAAPVSFFGRKRPSRRARLLAGKGRAFSSGLGGRARYFGSENVLPASDSPRFRHIARWRLI
jgi:hypothetical protein